MKELGLDPARAEHLLWDRILHRELTASGKSIIADKTPNTVFMSTACARVARRALHLPAPPPGRHRASRRPPVTHEGGVELIVATPGRSRRRVGATGHTVRYEALTAGPDAGLREVCSFLGVP